MDHQLDDSLNLDGAMGVDFEHSVDVVDSQSTLALEGSSHMDGISMEFENIEEQPMLMETVNEETVGLMGEEYTLSSDHDFNVQSSQDLETTIIDANQQNIMTSESIMDLQFEPKHIPTPTASTSTQRISIKAITPRATASMPRQVAIAPKPTPVAKQTLVAGKHFTIAPRTVTAIAPKPMTAVPRMGVVKKLALSGVMPGQKAGQTVIAQIGKQLVMMPTGGGQKIKLVQSSGGQPMQAQLISTKNIINAQTGKKQVMAKVVMQPNQASALSASDQPAVITKLTPAGAAGAPRFVTMQQKTVPISMANSKVVMGSPTSSGLRFSRPKQQIITVKSSPSKIAPAIKGVSGQKVVVGNPFKNLVLKTAIPHKTAQIMKPDGQTINLSPGQRQQIQTVNGVQYIRLVTNSTYPSKVNVAPVGSKPHQALSMSSKTFLIQDSKGNLIQMSASKVLGSQPPPLVVTAGAHKVSGKQPQKLVRIAPVMTKTSQSNTTTLTSARPGQSLLAPVRVKEEVREAPEPEYSLRYPDTEDSKESLRALLEGATVEHHQQEVEVDYEPLPSPIPREEVTITTEEEESRMHDGSAEHPLIVVPADEPAQYEEQVDHSTEHDDSFRVGRYMAEVLQSEPPSPPENENGIDDLRPRKACNCTKSQCLKLYCDCFANGEFCNRCNCTNCHNNLDNEEQRQKAIRGCLDRNPNAFRPKIGKARAGGPEPVRRHNKGCNCKRSGCLKNYCECYEAKIACTAICKCVGCRNVEEALERLLRRREAEHDPPRDAFRPPAPHLKQPCSFMTTEVIEAVCQCLIAAAAEGEGAQEKAEVPSMDDTSDPVTGVIEEFARCLQDIISASHQGPGVNMLDEVRSRIGL
ncbi:hypothetical protein JYU34_001550 [Plutella xylostella]|uniref:CRC domain-containing protein n=1 Tax=Plutella xylostella TaxID=51655 RepID=A0ABQ7R468_PLUXY|nr:hypothetical protein JYU34_001550 [Plutella xylostella]